MLLLTVREWIGPNRQCPPDKRPEAQERLVGMVTQLPLPDALQRLRQHQIAYNSHFTVMGITFGLVGVSEIEHLNTNDISNGGLEVVESLTIDYGLDP